MISYSEFKLTDAQLEHAKQEKAAKAISKYIKENGVEPTSTDEYYALTDEELEQYKRVYYAIYLSGNGSSSSTGSTDSGSTSSAGGITYIEPDDNAFTFQETLALAYKYASDIVFMSPGDGTEMTSAVFGETTWKGLFQNFLVPFGENLPERYCYKCSSGRTEADAILLQVLANYGIFVDEHLVVTIPENYDTIDKIHVFSFNFAKALSNNSIIIQNPNKADRIAIYMKDDEVIGAMGFNSTSYVEDTNPYFSLDGATALTINFEEAIDYYAYKSSVETLAITLKGPTHLYTNEVTLNFKTGTAPNITFTTAESYYKIAWANGTTPTFEANTNYMIKMRVTCFDSNHYFICEYCTFS